jgi:glucokinase
MSKHNIIIGLDIGGSKIGIVAGTDDGTVLSRREIPTNSDAPFAETLPFIAKEIDELKKIYGNIRAISVAIGGPLRIEEGYILCPPHLPGWHDLHLKKELEKYFAVPVYVEHDGNAGALAEWHFGAGQKTEHMIFLTAGTGLGAGIILNGKLHRGANDTAGEIGHIRLSDDGPEEYGKQGSWEAFACGSGIVKLAHMRFPNKWSNEMSPKEFIDIVNEEDTDALSVVKESGEWLGKGLAMLIDTLNPEIIVVGSLGRALGDKWLSPARRIVEKECLHQTHSICKIVPAKLGRELGDIASLMAYIKRDKD